MPKVSVIIVNYYSTAFLDKCLETLVRFTKSVAYEIIIIDNGSEGEEVENTILKYSERIKLIKNSSNAGFASANNQGIKESEGDYVLLLNNDTILIEDVIGKVVEYSKDIHDEAIIGCKLLNSDMTNQISIVDFDNVTNMFGESFFLYKLFPRNRRLNKYFLNYPNHSHPVEVEAIKGAFFFIPRKIFDKIGLLDERFHFYYEETDFCLRYKSTGGKVIYLPDVEIIHVGGGSTSNNLWNMFKNQHTARILFFNKHFSGLKYFLMIILHWIGLLLRVPQNIISGLLKFDKYYFKKAFCYLRSLFLFPRT